jgi:REP element-mobilizing transposase RayT
MSIIRVYLHYVWTTKKKIPFLSNPEVRNKVWAHMEMNAKTKGIHALKIGGHNDHSHCLISLSHDQTISKIAQLIKGESSHWINQSGLISDVFKKEKFDWQDEYFVESVSPHLLQSVLDYISIQDEHHKQYSFQQEIEKFLSEQRDRGIIS